MEESCKHHGIGVTLGFFALAAALLAPSAAVAVPIRYRFTGQLELTAGNDAFTRLLLDGATITIVARADTEDSASVTTQSPGGFETSAEYEPRALSIMVTDRPAGAPDAEIIASPPLHTLNRSVADDIFGVVGVGGAVLIAEPFNISPLSMPFIGVRFTSEDFFPGAGPAPPAPPGRAPSEL